MGSFSVELSKQRNPSAQREVERLAAGETIGAPFTDEQAQAIGRLSLQRSFDGAVTPTTEAS